MVQIDVQRLIVRGCVEDSNTAGLDKVIGNHKVLIGCELCIVRADCQVVLVWII